MAGHIDDRVDLAPAEEPVRADYVRDFYSWLIEQTRTVRDGLWDQVDRENLAEKIAQSLSRPAARIYPVPS
jgi:hypothetical protein